MLDLQALLETQITLTQEQHVALLHLVFITYPLSSSATQDITHPIYAKKPYKKPCMCRSMISLSKIAHQMWHNHSLSHRKKATEQWEWGAGGNREKGGAQNLKMNTWWSFWMNIYSGKIIGSCSSKVRPWDRYFKTKYKT